jgi:hypothetical protein
MRCWNMERDRLCMLCVSRCHWPGAREDELKEVAAASLKSVCVPHALLTCELTEDPILGKKQVIVEKSG